MSGWFGLVLLAGTGDSELNEYGILSVVAGVCELKRAF